MNDLKYKILEEKKILLESENRRLKLEDENKVLIRNQQKNTNQNFNNLILNNISAGIYLIETKTGNILYANPTFEKMFGYETDELVGKNVSIVNAVTEKTAKEVAFDIIQKLEQFGHWEGEVTNIKKDGTVFYCEAGVTTFEHSQYGTVWVSTHKDITEQKETRKVFLQSKTNILAILENTTDSIWAINTSYEILYANHAFISAFHNNFGVRLKPDVNLLLSLPESLKQLWKSRYDRVLSNEMFSFIDKIDTENSSIYFEVFMNPIVFEGKVIGASFFGKDITKRIQTEEALKDSQLLLTSSMESQNDTILFSINNKYQYLYFTKAHYNSMKFAYNKDVEIGINILDCITSEDDRIAAKDNYDRALKGESHTNIRTYGEANIAYYESFFNPILNDKNEIIGATGLARNITSRKKAEEALKESEIKLRELNTTKDKLFSIIAHDLRSPFNNILGFSELLIGNLKDLEVAVSEKYLGFINSSAQNTLILLDNLLNWAQSQTGQITFNPKKINLSSIIREVIEQSNSLAIAKKISLIHKQADEIEAYADEDILKTVLRNLITNAIKFTKSGGNISVIAKREQNQVEIAISDNGVGINEETCQKIFNVSTNKTSLGTANEKGSGLGLILCKEFVEKLGGRIWVESEEGKGSDFKFTLPLNKLE